MTRIIIFFLLTVLTLAIPPFSLAQDQDQNLSTKVLEHVVAVGAKRAISDYYDKPIWNEILKGISSGKREWLSVYKALRLGSDGASGEDIGEAIFDGIPSAPFLVLPLLYAENKGRLSVVDLCYFTFEASVPDGGINSYLTRIEQSLKSAKTKKEISIQTKCMQGLAKTRNEFKTNPLY